MNSSRFLDSTRRIGLAILLSLHVANVTNVAHAATAPSAPARELGKALDRAQRHVDEYGTLHVGAPVLTYARSNEFRFRLDHGASNYFREAKNELQGRAAAFEQSINVSGLDVAASADVTQLGAAETALSIFQNQLQSWQASQDARRTAAGLLLQADLANAATNTNISASNRAVALAHAAFATNLYDGSTPPAHPGAGSTQSLANPNALKLPIGLTDTNLARLIALQPFQALLANNSSGLSTPNRSALITAAGDHTVEKVFEQITGRSNPDDPYNPVKVFGMTTVSVQPGWRTRTGWAGEVVVYGELEFRPARQETVRRLLEFAPWQDSVKAQVALAYGYDSEELLRKAGVSPQSSAPIANQIRTMKSPEHPSSTMAPMLTPATPPTLPARYLLKSTNKPVQILVISPLTEVDTFDLASSYRRQSEFAMSLSFALRYAGAEGEARAFEKFARSLQHDIATRSTFGSVNAFSGQEGMFGFQIGPRVRALDDPARRRSESGNVLERQTFPALLLATFGRGDAEPRLKILENGTLKLYEPYLVLRQIRRWQPLSRTFFSGRDWYRPGDWFHPRLREAERLNAVDLLEQARDQANKLTWSGAPAPGWSNNPTAAALQRLDFFEQQLVGSVDHITLPEELVVPTTTPPLSESIARFTGPPTPAEVTLYRAADGTSVPTSARLTFPGSNLRDLDTSSIASLSSNAIARAAAVDGDTLIVFAEIRNADHPLAFSIGTDPKRFKTQSILTPAIQLHKAAHPGLPAITLITPTSVALSRQRADPTRFEPKTVDFVILGAHLDRIDFDGTIVAAGAAEFVSALHPSANGCVLRVKVNGDSGPVALKLPLRDGSGALLSLPVSVSAPPLPAADNTARQNASQGSQTLRLEQQPASGNSATNLTVTVNPSAGSEALEAATKVIVAQIEREKPQPAAPAKTTER